MYISSVLLQIGGPTGAPCCVQRCCAAGTRYARSDSGWFDSTCFESWFKDESLPHAKRIRGKKAIIGDNLSSHFSTEMA